MNYSARVSVYSGAGLTHRYYTHQVHKAAAI